jgi:hypothetical protein
MVPNSNFISRNINNEPLEKLLNQFGNNLDECVNFASNLFSWISESKTRDVHDTVLVSNLRHFIENIDACSELLKKSISEPCLVLLRAELELFLSGSYILQKNHEQRGKSFTYFQFLKNLKILDKLDVRTEAGKQMATIISKDDYLKNLRYSPPADIANIKTTILNRINSPAYADIHTEYTRIKMANPKAKLHWYSLFGGPTSVETLANDTGNSGKYEIFYRHTSGFVHGTEILENSVDSEGINGIRFPYNAQFICSFSLSLCFIYFKKYIEYYCNNKLNDYLEWYMPLREFYLSLNQELIKFK